MSKLASLTRRTFLRGAGAAVALPLLEGMPRPARAAAAGPAASAPPVRLAWVFFPNGTAYDRWQPKEAGPDWQLTRALEPLADHKGDLTVFSGLGQRNASSLGDGAGDHARSAATFLTGVHPVKSDSSIRVGRSIDQIVADRIGIETRLPSLELGTEAGRNAGSCDSGYSCAYSGNISWRTPTQPTAKEINPTLVFERLFGNGGSDSDARKRRMAYRQSILDMVADDASRLQKAVGASDRRKLDEYFTSVREVETRIERLRVAPQAEAPKDFAVPRGVPKDADEHIRLMYDLMVLAFQTDSTRVSTFMLANEGSNRTYPMIEVNDGHHSLSHHRNEEDKVEKIARIDRFFAEGFAYFLKRLKETKEGEGNLLDNSLVLYGCAIGDGNRHNHDKLPIILAGRGGGRVAPAGHVRYDDGTPLNNLLVSMAAVAGAEVKDFGDATGPLKGFAGG